MLSSLCSAAWGSEPCLSSYGGAGLLNSPRSTALAEQAFSGAALTQQPCLSKPAFNKLNDNGGLTHCTPCLQVKQIRIEYEYKLMLQPQQLNEQLREANLAKELAEAAMQQRSIELNEMKANAEGLQAQYLADIEAQHAVATEHLEAAYDKRFLVNLHVRVHLRWRLSMQQV